MPRDTNPQESKPKGQRIAQAMVLAALTAIGATGISYIGHPVRAHAEPGGSDHVGGNGYGGAQGGIAHDVNNPYNSANNQAIERSVCGACGGGGSSGTAANNSGAPGQGPGNHDGSQGTPFAWLVLPKGVMVA
jgi:hypothetical protein